ncbi:hypothetical protein HNR47_000248 [Methylopila jiangsuensis]|uniref:hypothetical protein n=1 Tax=Methylopila jiangsuensis TaxID=586230 RepID=UPI0022F2B77C|nr:hypothetical protein [Methylopila jiangsuensis]MDR6284265.1 hypothetical protein [Methylopila jiangsuensis]
MGLGARALMEREPRDRVSAEWRDLAERCIASIEHGTPLNTADLKPYAPPAGLRADRGFRPERENAWREDGGRFAIIENDVARNPTGQRKCRVVLATTYDALTNMEQAALIRTFLLLRRDMIADSLYETPHIDQIHPLVLLLARSTTRNARNCQTVVMLAFDPDNRSAWISVGERQDAPCGRSSPAAPQNPQTPPRPPSPDRI